MRYKVELIQIVLHIGGKNNKITDEQKKWKERKQAKSSEYVLSMWHVSHSAEPALGFTNASTQFILDITECSK